MTSTAPAGVSDLVADPRRRLPLEAVHNFRDLGGYPSTSDVGGSAGSIVRWGLLFRADGLHRLSPADVEVMHTLGLRTVVDLRMQTERDEHGSFPVDALPVELAHHPVMDRTWDVADVARFSTEAEFLLWAYQRMLLDGGPRFAAAFERLASPGALPAVFHCAAGKDRTGILAALVLGALGVPQSYVVGDYALTAAAMVRMREWALREHPEAAERFAETPSAFFAALPEAMDQLLDGLVVEHGSVREYVRSIGVSDAAVDSLRSQLLEPLAQPGA